MRPQAREWPFIRHVPSYRTTRTLCSEGSMSAVFLRLGSSSRPSPPFPSAKLCLAGVSYIGEFLGFDRL